jgi:hypothetical protein
MAKPPIISISLGKHATVLGPSWTPSLALKNLGQYVMLLGWLSFGASDYLNTQKVKQNSYSQPLRTN